MLFNSPEFLFIFLPVTLLAFHTLRLRGYIKGALFVLLIASLFFYGWWNPAYLLLIIASISGNFLIGIIAVAQGEGRTAKRMLIGLGICGNLALLGYYKYALFALATWAGLMGTPAPGDDVFLPLGISFFTFTQISYLMDIYNGRTRPDTILSYALFVTYFPHLIAGPIVHHRELAGQFVPAAVNPLNPDDVATGLTILAGGLFKKVVLADTLATYATPIFSAAHGNVPMDFLTAWFGALAYTFQLYFDFSGYSDMAIGLALLFGIRLPINFRSPYKATNIIDFWHRWHITLSHWLRDYLYIPLGGNRHGRGRQIAAVVVTMLVGGLWHGAGWTFVAWGVGHGFLLAANHAWRAVVGDKIPTNHFVKIISWLLTFIAIASLWVLFRAPDFSTAGRMLSAMYNPMLFPAFMETKLGGLAPQLASAGWIFVETGGAQLFSKQLALLLAASFLICAFLPNLYDLTKAYCAYLPIKGVEPEASAIAWRPHLAWAITSAIIFSYAALNSMISTSEFLYYQF